MTVLTLPQSATTPLSVRAKALVFEDAQSQALHHRIAQVAPSDATILVVGETGTGKEIVARHVHALSRRRDRQFVAVNCGAFAESLAESELFGHERGAFTGAITSKAGWFEAADGGTLFLDEIGDLPPSIQVKLLRVLQEGEVVRLGSRKATPIDVRLIAATNVDLEAAVSAGRFREDLFYRLNVAKLSLLPLRERPGDILPLAEYFLEVYSERLGVPAAVFTQDAERRLLDHVWPGNIRELENVVHHALLLCRGSEIGTQALRLTSLPPRASQSPPAPVSAPSNTLEAALTALFETAGPNLHERIEETVFRTAYRFCDSNQVQTAKLLGISRNIVRARLIEYGELAGTPRSRPPAAQSDPPRDELLAVKLPDQDALRRLDASASGADAPGPQRRAAVRQTVRVGYQCYGLLMLVKSRGTFDRALAELGAAVEWRSYPGGLELVQALSTSQVSLGVVGEGPPIFAHAARLPITYLAAEAGSPEGEAIVVHDDSPLRTAGDLRGKTIALNKGANVHYLLIQALEEAGLGYDDVTLRYLSPERAREAFAERSVDAWGIWDPMLASVQHATGARVLRDARGIATNATYYISTTAFAESEPRIVEVFLAELGAAAAWARENPGLAAAALARECNMPEAAMSLALARNTGVRSLGRDLVLSQQSVANAFFRTHLIPTAVSVQRATWQLRRPRATANPLYNQL
jgi:aliphatic sulfonates family ABC transporter substrate-binding protein